MQMEKDFLLIPAKKRAQKVSEVLVHDVYQFKFGTDVQLEFISMSRMLF